MIPADEEVGLSMANANTTVEDMEITDEDPSERKVGSIWKDLNCLCNPTRAKRPGEICSRLGKWSVANANQFVSSIVVSICMIPEAISYAIIAGLPPSFGLQACWISCMMTAFIGGRPGMITSASGLSALILSRLVNTDTIGASSIMFVPLVVAFAGALQGISACIGLSRLAANFPEPMIIGMVNALAILAIALQFRYAKVFPLTEEDTYVETAATGTAKAVELEWVPAVVLYFGSGLAWLGPWMNLFVYAGEVAVACICTMYLPRVTPAFPAPIVAMLAVVVVEFGLARQFNIFTPLIMDYGGVQVEYPWTTVLSPEYSLPSFSSIDTWKIIMGYGSALFATQFVETSIALNVVNRLDESNGPGFLVLFGQGISNAVIGFMGGMGANGSVSMSVLADRTFGTTCLSTFLTGFMMFVFMAWGYPVIDYMPLSAISGINIAIACSFIQWRSLVAIFTTCLPERRRKLLPPYFQFGRLEVFFIFFICAGCLTADISAMLFFVFAVGVFLFNVCYKVVGNKNEKEETVEGTSGAIEASVSNTIAKLMQEGVLPESSSQAKVNKRERVDPMPDPEEADDASVGSDYLDSIASSWSSKGDGSKAEGEGIYYVHSEEDDDDSQA
eukprot:scaffold1709_cov151-Skeletonema_menzelii.AAC.16